MVFINQIKVLLLRDKHFKTTVVIQTSRFYNLKIPNQLKMTKPHFPQIRIELCQNLSSSIYKFCVIYQERLRFLPPNQTKRSPETEAQLAMQLRENESINFGVESYIAWELCSG